MKTPYEGQEADPILQEFHRNAASISETEHAASCGISTPTSESGSTPVRQRILQSFKSATISPANLPAFVPMDTLTELIDVETVSMALAEAGRPHLWPETCNHIVQFLPRVFATLLVIGNVEAILDFGARHFTDSSFPLMRDNSPPEDREISSETWYSTIHPFADALEDYDGMHPVSRCFQDPSLWTLDGFERFCEEQWIFSAEVFVPTKFEYLLAPQSPLPFTTLTPHWADGVLRSQVYTASIHPAHLSLRNTVRSFFFFFFFLFPFFFLLSFFFITALHWNLANIHRISSWEQGFWKSRSRLSRSMTR